MNIILIGPRCVGKTDTGRHLAKMLNYKFIDSDVLLEKRNKTTINKIVSKKGWEHFRELENKNIKFIVLNYRDRIVLALGGGAIAHEYKDIREKNLKLLKKYGKMVFLFPSKDIKEGAKVLFGRIKKDTKSKTQRPSLTNLPAYKEMLKVIKKRWDYYNNAADCKIYTEKNSEKKVAELITKTFFTISFLF